VPNPSASVTVIGSGSAEITVHPPNYYDEPALRLAYDSSSKFSIDEAGGKFKKTKSNTPLEYVKKLQTDLITLGYLPKPKDPKQSVATGVFVPATRRAVLRFQRHARRVYRITRPAKPSSVQENEIDDVAQGETFKGEMTGVCDHATALEIKKWLDRTWVNPVGRFRLRLLKVKGVLPRHTMRQDAADVWEKIVADVASAGGVLTATRNGYGDTVRWPAKSVAANKVGASSFSFHFSGRAVDIDQGFAGGSKRYFLLHEPAGDRTYWRILCKTDLQDGSQGVRYETGSVKHIKDVINLSAAEIPAGYYLDMTAAIEQSGKFKRIPAQPGFDDKTKKTPRNLEDRYNKTEWWHFQYTESVQATFQDEMELVGFTEADLRSKGWARDEELDHPPG